jgi:hypothetical protein
MRRQPMPKTKQAKPITITGKTTGVFAAIAFAIMIPNAML